MRCHYEILDISKDAEFAEIKTAYRKLALKWHPDKNLDQPDHAKEQFQLVQQAYEVLSDPQERAWYDKHREQILKGKSSDFQDNSLDVFQYFTTTCFQGFNDTQRGFYTVYRGVFDQIIKEDLDFIDEKEEFGQIPTFGDSKSDYDSVVGPFYSYWSSYCTKKSYVWLDPYNINETRDRRILKIIEKENKKVRQKAKKERNEEVRNLVAFVRKRDKRVQEHTKILEAKVLENRQKQEEITKQKRLERKKMLDNSGEQAEWSKFDNVQSELEEIEKNLTAQFGEDTLQSDEEEINDLYCVACNKLFKTSKAFENHESSRKHKENVILLKEIMLEEEGELDDTEVGTNLFENPISEENEDSDSSTEKVKKRKKNKKLRNILSSNVEEIVTDEDLIMKINDSDDNFDSQSSKKQKKKNVKKNNKAKAMMETPIEGGKTDESRTAKCKKGSKKEKDQMNGEKIDTNHCCVTCKSQFLSKNKLFDHLKKTGHGVYIPNKETISRKKTKKET